MNNFANGYIVFTHIFLLSVVIGVAAFIVSAYMQVKAENKAKHDAKTAVIVASLMRKCGKFEVTYQEKYDTYYVFNTETGAFVAQNENPVTLLEYMRDHYISYNLEAADENTARTMVASVKRIMTEKQKSELFQHGVQEV